MKNINRIDIAEVRAQEESTQAGVRLDNHGLEKIVPLAEFECHLVTFESSDLDRTFILFETGLAALTPNNNSRLRNVVKQRALDVERIVSFFTPGFDLRKTDRLKPVLVGIDLDGPLTIIDGNHRTIAQYLKFDSIEGIMAYVCVHRAINTWRYIPPEAR